MERDLLQKSEEYERLEGQLKEIKREYDEKKDQVTKAEELFANLCGYSTYSTQLQEARDSEAHALGKITNVEKEKFYLNEGLTKIEPSAIEKTLSNINWGPSIEENLRNEKTILENKIEEITEKCKILASNLSYSDSIPNFNHSQIQGRVGELISVQDEKYLDALDICAGGKLYYMVVENEDVVAQIIEGGLQDTTRFIPLNKIQTFKLLSEKEESIQNIAPGRINLAKTLIKYDERVEPAMEIVFGSTLICEDADAARKVFDSDIQMRCVTLNGEAYDFSEEIGSIEGGIRPTSGGALKTIQELKESKQQLKNCRQELDNLNATIKNTQATADEYNKIKRQLDLKANEVASYKLEVF
ncbi:SMCs flexible hinge [Glomus cerebriforme]|uniref:SMCs flexible hinge n=1 Tax=Glomus cerebriforme TaxID=658196 RepID=A0A397S283_9GLOM|nr:SMCs flexible hinge [Glomus cerebriforme]